MEAHVLHEFSCNLALVNISSVSCSPESGHIALMTSTGVCIFCHSVRGDIRDLNGHLEKFYIPSPKEFGSNETQRSLSTQLSRFTLELQHMICLDQHLMPENGIGHQNFFKQLRWSTKCVNFNTLFALLTQCGQLTIYQQKGSQWIECHNLTTMFNIAINAGTALKLTDTTDLNKIRHEVYSTLIDCIEWTRFRCISETERIYWCNLLSATKSGDLHIFRIIYSNHKVKIDYDRKVNLEFPGPITLLQTHEDLLFIAMRNGQLWMFPMVEDDARKAFDIGQNDHRIEIWKEMDDIPISTLKVAVINSQLNVLFGKGVYTVATRLIRTKGGKLEQVQQCVMKSERALDLDAICRIDERTYLGCSKDSHFTCIRIKDDTFEQEIVNNLGMANLCPYGIGSSRNGFIFCCVSNICAYYDHLLLREATRVDLFTFLSGEQSVRQIEKLYSQSDQRENQFRRYHDLFDCCSMQIGQGDLSVESFDFCLPIHRLDKGHLKQKDKLHLQIIRFLVLSLLTRSKTVAQSDQIKLWLRNTLNASESLLIKLHAKQRLQQQNNASSRLTDRQKCSLQLLRDFATDRPTQRKSITSRKRTKEPASVVAGVTKQDVCLVCQRPIISSDCCLTVQCDSNHVLPRCSYSLLVCQLPDTYEKCDFCRRSFYIYPTIWPEKHKYCVFCAWMCRFQVHFYFLI